MCKDHLHPNSESVYSYFSTNQWRCVVSLLGGAEKKVRVTDTLIANDPIVPIRFVPG